MLSTDVEREKIEFFLFSFCFSCRAAKLCGISCTVVVPEGTPAEKVALIKKYGADCVICAPTPTARYPALFFLLLLIPCNLITYSRKETCTRIAREQNKVEVPPYDDLLVLAGQGTVWTVENFLIQF
jgi:threonine dehydratase